MAANSIFPLIDAAARTAGVDPALFRSLITRGENSYQGWQTSPAGAFGPAQLMPGTARELQRKYGIDPNTPQGNLQGGAHYLAEQMRTFRDPVAAAIAYNAGPGNAQKWLRAGRDFAALPRRSETEPYVKRVMGGIGQDVLAGGSGGDWMAEIDAAVGLKAGKTGQNSGSGNWQSEIDAAVGLGASQSPGKAAGAQPPQPAPAQQDASKPAPAASSAPPPSRWERFTTGLGDAGMGLDQMLAHAVPETRAAALDLFGMKDEPRTPEAVDARLREREAKNKVEGVDWARMAGNVATSLPLAVAGGGMGAALATGGIAGALQPATGEGDFGTQKAVQAGVGALTGGATNRLTAGLGRALAPRNSPNVTALLNEGVTPTPGQALGGIANRIEERAMSLPIVGDAIRGGRMSAETQLNKAALQRAVAPIGENVSTVGREGLSEVSNKLSAAYNDVLPHVTFTADAPFRAQMQNLDQMAQSLPGNAVQDLRKVVRTHVVDRLNPQTGMMDGVSLKQAESELGRISRTYRGSENAVHRDVGHAIEEVRSAVRDALQRQNPNAADRLAAINRGYADYAILRRAAGSVGAEGGEFSAAQLQSAVKAGDRSVGKGNFARGRANMQDLSDPAVSVLKSKVPNSGTADRLMQAGGLGGALVGSILDPTGITAASTLGAGALSYGMYSPLGRKLMAELLMRRPGVVQAAGKHIGQLSPASSPSAVAVAGALQDRAEPRKK